jgi:glycosyltransferase involved in cell wall biosynthesis
VQPYLIVSWDFVRTGGMDMANYALASWLADRGREVHLVAHSVAPDLLGRPNVIFHRVPKVAASYVLSEPLLDRVGRTWARIVSRRGGRVIVNGGNCCWGDLNWVHYVHAAYQPFIEGSVARTLQWRWSHRRSLRQEKKALGKARLILSNSRLTSDHLVDRLQVPRKRVSTIYYGIDRDRFRPASPEDRAAARAALGFDENPIAAFIGALSDRRKGFDTVFKAWRILCADANWDVRLMVVGVGSELPSWERRTAEAGLDHFIRFLGFRSDVHRALAASDALVAPTRYEAYGLGVHEAICCGLPAFVTATAGVAERYPSTLSDFLIRDPEDPGELCLRLRAWRARTRMYGPELSAFSDRMRERTWNDMASQIVDAAEEGT